jgi:hypothetical protein
VVDGVAGATYGADDPVLVSLVLVGAPTLWAPLQLEENVAAFSGAGNSLQSPLAATDM